MSKEVRDGNFHQNVKATWYLIADDERAIADMLAIILNEQGCNAHAVCTGHDEVERARDLHPDFIISDIIKPDMHGIEAAIRIREFLPSCKILLMTGQSANLEGLVAHRDQHGRFAERILPKTRTSTCAA